MRIYELTGSCTQTIVGCNLSPASIYRYQTSSSHCPCPKRRVILRWRLYSSNLAGTSGFSNSYFRCIYPSYLNSINCHLGEWSRLSPLPTCCWASSIIGSDFGRRDGHDRYEQLPLSCPMCWNPQLVAYDWGSYTCG